MNFEHIVYTKENGVATIKFNRPKSFNSLDLDTSCEFVAAVEKCTEDVDVRSVIITGEGKAFCSGGDIAYFKKFLETAPSEPFRDVMKYLNLAIIGIRRMPKPVIAAVNGAAGGAGMSVAAACDLRICAASAKFRQAYTGIGMVGDEGWTLFVPLLIGFGRTMELLLLDPIFDAKQALEWGLVTQVVEDEKLKDTTLEIAAKLAQGPTKAYAIAKENLNRSMMANLESQLELERIGMMAASRTEDYVEGVRAFLEKRKPVFKGR
ncbi:MAG TPA: enoyl-CoA hydratase-related protein [Syntrophales bacterium]|nr:enoyl-CoA hydratase/isomerase family protein [Syntrophobacterales bacterium]HRR42365.1 enoyl-CoA hydratase-related protein [Syntrophales bacterium]HRT28130.1 enoyl-CoA hydratase-related protein [Syntrophales bacterium]HRT71840.1 enoyl-CoA hydratase-related protein [Syntrophales bacterium]